jgi:hypothetical protein
LNGASAGPWKAGPLRFRHPLRILREKVARYRRRVDGRVNPRVGARGQGPAMTGSLCDSPRKVV